VLNESKSECFRSKLHQITSKGIFYNDYGYLFNL